MLVAKIIPCIPILAVILAHCAPLALAQIRPPFFPRCLRVTRLNQSFLFCIHFISYKQCVGNFRAVPAPAPCGEGWGEAERSALQSNHALHARTDWCVPKI